MSHLFKEWSAPLSQTDREVAINESRYALQFDFFSFEAKDFAFYITSLSTLKINQILKAYTRTDFSVRFYEVS